MKVNVINCTDGDAIDMNMQKTSGRDIKDVFRVCTSVLGVERSEDLQNLTARSAVEEVLCILDDDVNDDVEWLAAMCMVLMSLISSFNYAMDVIKLRADIIRVEES